MKALITGMNGTVAPALAQALSNADHLVVPWDRSVVPIDDPQTVREFIRSEQPDWFFHIATGSADWAELASQVCAKQGIKFLFTSSVSVFSSSQRGPFTVDDLPKPDDDYGRYKLECEQRVRAAHSESLIVRLGWQIGTVPGANHMVDYLDRSFRTQGYIDASIHWYQACSFLSDTSLSLTQIMQTLSAGLYHLDGNPGLNFYQIVVGLNSLQAKPWIVKPSESPVQNNQLLDRHVQVNPITNWFKPEN